jgi:hypothetical protein
VEFVAIASRLAEAEVDATVTPTVPATATIVNCATVRVTRLVVLSSALSIFALFAASGSVVVVIPLLSFCHLYGASQER